MESEPILRWCGFCGARPRKSWSGFCGPACGNAARVVFVDLALSFGLTEARKMLADIEAGKLQQTPLGARKPDEAEIENRPRPEDPPRRRVSASGIPGVLRARGGRWAAKPFMGGRQIYLGVFETIEQAASAIEKFKATGQRNLPHEPKKQEPPSQA